MATALKAGRTLICKLEAYAHDKQQSISICIALVHNFYGDTNIRKHY